MGNSTVSSNQTWSKQFQGSFTVTISAGLVRLGVCATDSDVDNLGTDLRGFGYGGTGKMPGSEILGGICSRLCLKMVHGWTMMDKVGNITRVHLDLG